MQKIAYVPFPQREAEWLTNAEAAEALRVDVRTIKRWTTQPETCAALSAVRHGKQWRIPRPNNLDHWRCDTRWRLKKLGLELTPEWKRDLRKIAKENSRSYLESCRLWLAASMKALGRGRITPEAGEAIRLLKWAACKILGPLPRHEMEVENLKSRFPAHLRENGLPNKQIRAVMDFWPEKDHFELVRDAHTLDELEAIRRKLDYAQAARDLEEAGQEPTANNLRPLLHKDLMEHINDTRDELPGVVVKNPTGEEMRLYTMASVQDQIIGKTPPLVTFDLREPQNGLALRTFRNRHPLKQPPQREIVATVFGARDSIPGADEKLRSGKTPIRGSAYEQRPTAHTTPNILDPDD